MMNPYENCPVFENENYLLRLIEASDASDLLAVYSDENAWPIFNSDNCTGNFQIITLEQMERVINMWLHSYHISDFIRWTIYDKRVKKAVGTIELFNRKANDYFNHCGLLRLDVGSEYERLENLSEILSLILMPTFEMFSCDMIATKIVSAAKERKNAFEAMGFTASAEKLIGGHTGKIYTDYYVFKNKMQRHDGIPKG
ncbi:MAG: GNAT family N-acetyltransferase [Clostridia bacterium]|nr:GNAT family N-acetyltransferase [Clostridia bacterium]